MNEQDRGILRVLVIIIFSGAISLAGCVHLVSGAAINQKTAAPAKTGWAPKGPRNAGNYDYSVLPEPDTFHAMHVGPNNTDNLWIAAAPMVEYDWLAEAEMYIPEGPVFDNEGGLYFSPVLPKEDVSLVCLDRVTGERRWSVAGKGQGSGAPLVLNDPENPGRQTIYHSTYETAMALRPDGSVIWRAPTGLKAPAIAPGEDDGTKLWGMNYHPRTDSLINVSIDGLMFALDRKTGRRLTEEPYQVPGAPAAGEVPLPELLHKLGNSALEKVFGKTGDTGLFTRVLNILYGKGVVVANFYGVDPNTGRIYVAATEPDDKDGAEDGKSKNGALYLLDLVRTGDGGLEFKTIKYYSFVGGTGSTPAISPSGDRVMVSDDNGYVIALDADLNEAWRVDVGAQVAASIAMSPDNHEIYAVTKYDVIKIIDQGDRGELAWRADLDDFPGPINFNTLTPTITANGIAVGVGGGVPIGGEQLMLHIGMGLLDRETGKLRYFAEGREDSISVTAVGPDGGYYIGSSPIRRSVSRGLLGDAVPPITGGIQRYKPVRRDLLVRDATCAAEARALNAATISEEHPQSAREDIRQVRVLVRQSREALDEAVRDGDMTPEQAKEVIGLLDEAESNLSLNGLPNLAQTLGGVCGMYD